MREFTLPKNNDIATIEVLGIKHLAQVLGLQDETRAALPEGQKMFVLPQSVEYFARLLERINGYMIGVRVRGQLVAQMAMMGSVTLDDAIARNTITRNEVHFHHALLSDVVVVAKSMAVHPDWRGNELSQHMLEAALEQPAARMADHVFAQISVDNVRSWELFLKQGFGIVAGAVDVTDQKPRFVLQKPALDFALHERPGADNLDPTVDFTTIMQVTRREALIGQVDEDGPGMKLAFHALKGAAMAWTEDEEVV